MHRLCSKRHKRSAAYITHSFRLDFMDFQRRILNSVVDLRMTNACMHTRAYEKSLDTIIIILCSVLAHTHWSRHLNYSNALTVSVFMQKLPLSFTQDRNHHNILLFDRMFDIIIHTLCTMQSS